MERLEISRMFPPLVHPEPVIGVLPDVSFKNGNMSPREFRDVFLAVGIKPAPVDLLEDRLVSSVLLPEQGNKNDGSAASETESGRPLVGCRGPAEEINEE